MSKDEWRNTGRGSPSIENENLIENNKKNSKLADQKLSKVRELAMMFALYFVQFLALCSDSLIFPFFPQVAVKRGVPNLSIGLVFASYDLTRFLASPICGSWVSHLHAL